MVDEAEKAEHERRLAELLAQSPGHENWLKETRSFARDAWGRTILLGLSAAETEEFLQLLLIVNADLLSDISDFERRPGTAAQRDRCDALQEQHRAACTRDAAENRSHFDQGSKKQ